MRYILVVVSLVIAALLVMDFNSRTANLNQLTAEHAVVKEKLDQARGDKSRPQADDCLCDIGISRA